MAEASKARTLREALASGRMVVAPGAYDGLTARLVEQAGFRAVYMTGAGTSAGHGYPDLGLLTMSEMVANARRMVDVTSVPLISDIDTGYGNELNVYRTIQEFERAGVAGVHLEDQVFPKRCGHLDNKEIVPLEEYVAKIRAAADARRDKNMVLIARTDARAVVGFEEAARRCNAALAAGADVAFFEAPQTLEEVRAVPKTVRGPCLLNVVQGGKTPVVSAADAEAMGYAIAIVPGLLTRAIVALCDQVLGHLAATGLPPETPGGADVVRFFERLGASDWERRRTAYREPRLEQAAE
jgi:2-methylisocitrate lyase-like PEP mutase family enzyme